SRTPRRCSARCSRWCSATSRSAARSATWCAWGWRRCWRRRVNAWRTHRRGPDAQHQACRTHASLRWTSAPCSSWPCWRCRSRPAPPAPSAAPTPTTRWWPSCSAPPRSSTTAWSSGAWSSGPTPPPRSSTRASPRAPPSRWWSTTPRTARATRCCSPRRASRRAPGASRRAGSRARRAAEARRRRRATKRRGPLLTAGPAAHRPVRASPGGSGAHRHVLGEPRLVRRLRLGADHDLDGLRVLEQDHRRDAHHTELLVDGHVVVDVELADLDLALVLLGQLLDDGADHAARPAPGRPEVDEHETRLGLLREVVVGELDEVGHLPLLLGARSRCLRGVRRRGVRWTTGAVRRRQSLRARERAVPGPQS